MDESWALTMREFAAGRVDAGFLLGSGLPLFVTAQIATAVGQLASAAFGDPAQWGLDFAFTAVFAALLIGLWKGNLITILVAARTKSPLAAMLVGVAAVWVLRRVI